MPAVRLRTRRSDARHVICMLVIALCAATSLAAAALPLRVAADDNPASAGGSRELVFGALLSLTGEWSTLGQASKAALELATADINAHLAATGSAVRIRFIIEDTRLDPPTALAQVQAMAAQGVRIVVGPQSSAEVRVLKPWVDANGVVLISQGSTASSLALAGDNVFRLVPDDVREAEALVTLLAADGVRAVVPTWRTDDGNIGLHDSVRRLLEAAGGVIAAGVSYDPDTTDFGGVAALLGAQVRDTVTQYGAGATAVYLAAFDEVVGIFRVAQHDPVLSSVNWYGSDGVAQSDVLLGDAEAARFAALVSYPNPLLGLDDSDRSRWQPVADRITAQTGREPDAFGLAAYDAAWIATLAQVAAGDAADEATLRDAVMQSANGYDGITGRTMLNAAGDRATGSFDFWAIRDDGGVSRWVRVARYEPVPGGQGRIVRMP
jgi:branched-chain amino acid transport system substrate-binding protein